MMRRSLFSILVASAGLCTTALSAQDFSVGIVNFATCVSDSKLGKQEQASFESLKKQMASMLEETENQLNDISAKFNDPDYLDGLSPEAEEELKVKFRTLSEELARYQNQYYQVLNQANMRVIQTLSSGIGAASEKVAKDKKLSAIMNKDACFYYLPSLDVTSLVIAEMDKTLQQEGKKQAAAPAPSIEPAPMNAEKTEGKAQ